MSDATDVPEDWRPVVGYEGFYEVSNWGRVRSLSRTVYAGRGHYRQSAGRIRTLSPYRPDDPRRVVMLSKYGRVSSQRVATLVLNAFVGPRPDGMEACHYDGDATNDRIENLRWDTRSANIYDAVRHGTQSKVSRTHCPFGHLLAEPNLVPSSKARGRRGCLACSRGRGNVQTARRLGLELDLKEAVDAHYVRIMGRAQVTWRGGNQQDVQSRAQVRIQR